ncbi:organic cyclic compound binding protein [[Candida] boidinii]|nr:organic cyclic compound binding protein [[Candida] boidinii]
MPDYSDDDMIDYQGQENDQFDEDALNDEEYDDLYELLPKIQEFSKSFNNPELTELKLKELLWLNYFDLEKTKTEIQSGFKRISEKPSLTEHTTSNGKNEDISPLQKLLAARKDTETKKKLESSKLNGLKISGGGLSSLMNKKIADDNTITSTETSTTDLTTDKPLSKLQMKLSSMKESSLDHSKTSHIGLSSLLKKRKEKEMMEIENLSSESKSKNSKTSNDNNNNNSSTNNNETRKALEPLNSNLKNSISKSSPFIIEPVQLPPVSKNLLMPSTNLSNSFDSSNIEIVKRRKLLNVNLSSFSNIFNVFTNNPINNLAKKTKENFKKPSPDDVVLNAQKNSGLANKDVNQVTNDISNLKIGAKEDGLKPKTPKVVPATKSKVKIDLDKELSLKNSRPNLSAVVIGHVDSGKSTIVGRLLYDLKIVDSKTLHKLTKESETAGKASFSLAWVMDQTPEERNRGVTIDICQIQFSTKKSNFTIIDSPGHKDYVPQMINGVSQADLAIIIIDSDINAFEKGFDVNGQTREHITIAKNLGIDRCIIAVNKMDSVEWSEDRFNEIESVLNDFFTEDIGFKSENITYIPTSGYLGGNVVNKEPKCSWYHGPTLIELLEMENSDINKDLEINEELKKQPFIMTINDLQETNKDDEIFISGRVNSGLVLPGETIAISPAGETGIIDQITISKTEVGNSSSLKEQQKLAISGEFVTIKVKKIENLENIKIGDMISIVDKPIQSVKLFKSTIKLFNIERPLLIGTPFVLFRNNISTPARITKIEQVSTIVKDDEGKLKKITKKKNIRHLSSKQYAVVEVEILERPLPLVKFSENKKIGRIVIRKDGLTIGAGIVE